MKVTRGSSCPNGFLWSRKGNIKDFKMSQGIELMWEFPLPLSRLDKGEFTGEVEGFKGHLAPGGRNVQAEERIWPKVDGKYQNRTQEGAVCL